MGLLTLIVILPLVGFLVNGLLATRLVASPMSKGFVSLVGCGLPIASFALAVKATADLLAGSDCLIHLHRYF